MEYVSGPNQVLLNFSEKYCKNEIEVMNSDCFKNVWERYLEHLVKVDKQDLLKVVNICPNPKKDFITLFKLLYEFTIKEIRKIDPYFKTVLDYSEVIYELIENFYDYWRRIERYGFVTSRSGIGGLESSTFNAALDSFTNVILNTYRTVSQKLLGENFAVYRALPAGVNAGILISKHQWMEKTSKYYFLAKSKIIEMISLRPPFISYSKKNKRTGIYQEVDYNPICQVQETYKADEYFCYAAHVGSCLAYVYFHRDYLAHGITLSNLFDFVPLNKCNGQKPDLLYIFGADINHESVFYHDKEDDIYVGVAPHDDSIDYFGYMKKMLLTLYNVKMIDNKNLPLHGACVNISLRNGVNKNIVIIGDSGAGKSESLEALNQVAKDSISNQLTIFDDMGTFKLIDGSIYAFGTEIGAFVRIDDMGTGYAYREIDRAIFMNPDRSNSRLVIPVATYKQIMKGYKVDMVLYANNYDDVDVPLKIFDNKDEALKTFVRGARNAKGTTQEIGLVESFFANPFGPVQRQEQTKELLDLYFSKLFEENVLVGEIYTKLGIPGMERKGPAKAALKLFEILEK